MKKLLLLFLLPIFSLSFWSAPQTTLAAAPAKTLTVADIVGRLVLQTDSDNKLWYIDPAGKERWYLHNEEDLAQLIAATAVKPTTAEFAQLAKKAKSKTPAALLKKYGGKIIASPAEVGVNCYLNPADGVCYAINNFYSFYKAGQVIGKPIKSALLRQLAMNDEQDTYDPAFYGIASVKYDGDNFSGAQNSRVVLPLASLTKLMTALVFLDTDPDWDKIITITPEEIAYPCTLQLCGTTSEIDLRAGDQLKIQDLWAAMLSASSNQSAVILADNSGLSREEFVQRMNAKATSTLGLKRTKFVEMSGLSPDNVSTAEEFARIAALAFGDWRISDATKHSDYIFSATQADGRTRPVKVVNRNTSLMAISPAGASKSGYLVEAQRNAAVEKNGQVAVALHCYSLTQRNNTISQLLRNVGVALAYHD